MTHVRGNERSRQLRLEANPSRVETPITDHLNDFAPDLEKYEGGNFFFFACKKIQPKLRSITPMTTKVHMILQSFVVLTWMCDIIELM